MLKDVLIKKLKNNKIKLYEFIKIYKVELNLYKFSLFNKLAYFIIQFGLFNINWAWIEFKGIELWKHNHMDNDFYNFKKIVNFQIEDVMY